MASLQARSPLRSAPSLIVVNKLVSLTAFGILLIAGCLLLCYLKFEPANRGHNSPPDNAAGFSAPAVRAQAAKPEVPQPPRLVYSCAQDTQYFHSSAHLPANCKRTAMPEDSAVQRGLKPCGVCFPE